jgi:dTDP-L-rhamnose 4-epimerase
MKNILITGGAGFIGSNIALKLIAQGFNVTVFDCLDPQIHGTDPEKSSPLYRSIEGKVRFVRGSVTDREAFTAVLEGQDAVVHLAAGTGTGQSMYDIEKYVSTNVGGTALLLDILTNVPNQVKKVVLSSSRAVYGEGKYKCSKCGIVYPKPRKDEDMQKGDFECKCPICGGPVDLLPTTEDSELSPSSVYGITKQTQEQLVRTVCASIGIDSVIFRYQNVYGAGQSLSNPYTGILSIFSTIIKNHNRINLFEDGQETRDFVYIDDVADATILGLLKDSGNGHTFNVGTGELTTVETVAKTLMAKYGIQVPCKITGNYRLGDIRHNHADISAAQALLGYQPKISFEKGMEIFTSWVNTQEVMADKSEESMEEMRKKGLFK